MRSASASIFILYEPDGSVVEKPPFSSVVRHAFSAPSAEDIISVVPEGLPPPTTLSVPATPTASFFSRYSAETVVSPLIVTGTLPSAGSSPVYGSSFTVTENST